MESVLNNLDKEFYSWRDYMLQMVLTQEWDRVAEAALKLHEIKIRGEALQEGIKLGVDGWA